MCVRSGNQFCNILLHVIVILQLSLLAHMFVLTTDDMLCGAAIYLLFLAIVLKTSFGEVYEGIGQGT